MYPSGINYPFSIADPIGTGSIYTPVLVVVNYSDSYPNGFSGTNLSLPTTSSYTNSIASNKTESSTLYGQGRVYSVFQNLGALYARILVATQGYIGALTVDHLTTNAGNNSYIDIDDGFICFYDSNGNLRIKMGQDTGDVAPVLNFYSATDSTNPIYNLGPDGIIKASNTYVPATWTVTNAYYRSTQFHAQELLSQYSTKDICKYEDAYQFIRSGNNSKVYVLQYVNPFASGGFSAEHSPLHEKYFKEVITPTAHNYYLNYADEGFYMFPPTDNGSSITAEIYQITNASSGTPIPQTVAKYRATLVEVQGQGDEPDYRITNITSL